MQETDQIQLVCNPLSGELVLDDTLPDQRERITRGIGIEIVGEGLTMERLTRVVGRMADELDAQVQWDGDRTFSLEQGLPLQAATCLDR